MQVSNSIGLYQTVFGQSSNDSITKELESKVNTSKSGMSLTGLTDISYKYKYKLMNSSDFEALGLQGPKADESFRTSSSGSPDEIQKYKNYWAEKANDKDTKAIIRIGNEVMGLVNQNGGTTSKSSITELMQKSGGDLNKLSVLLTEKYGRNFSIETFEKNFGPTVSEAHELLNGTSLSSYLDNEIQLREQSYKRDLQRTEETQKQKLIYNQSPQLAIFSVGGIVVGSINEKGYLEVNDNILRLADAKNIDREALKAFYSYDKISNTDTESVKEMLENVFNNDVKAEGFEVNNRPTLEEVRNISKAKLLPL